MIRDKYWHIQMHKPYGNNSDVRIRPEEMLMESHPIIGTGEWDDSQCKNFKTIPVGSIVLVREGGRAIALCEITGENFTTSDMEGKYYNTNFREVKILGWAEDYRQPNNGKLFSQGTFSPCNSWTSQYRYIDEWLDFMEKKEFINECKELLEKKHNLILQGAPGTGKTYNTAALALSILGENIPVDHKDVMKRYNELQNDRIFFTTFHQSMDYEDFVEGLKPRIQEDKNGNSIGVTYEPEDGIFKMACNAVYADDTKDISECIDEYLQSIKGFANKKKIPTITGKSSLYVWWNDGNATISTRSLNSKSDKSPEHSPSPLNIQKVKLQAIGKGCENNWQQYSQAFINAVKNEYMAKKDQPVVLIIDEINRGNISKIFGELITLLEVDKRDNGHHPIKVTLPYSKTLFSVPSNLFIIGTMNTTDRSTGTLDYALRRRFAFKTIKANSQVIEEHYQSGQKDLKDKAIALFDDIYEFIADPKHLCGEMDIDDLMVGHSYFMADDEDELKDKMKYEVVPLVNEYINDGILNVSKEEKSAAFKAWEELNIVKKETDQSEDVQ